ncbi:MAG: zinc ribbon domain-containing protein [Rubrivivax sp.]|nr:zinc ribbon domain-containing protein [Rubrivivax sp.]
MPIYAYRCSSCGHAQDMLQKISDPVLTTCPACGAETYTKQVTAAGFQLKGSGWYVTDFRGGNNAGKKDADKPADKAAEGGAPEAKGAEKPAAPATPATPAAAAAAPSAAAPAAPASGD